MDHGPIHIYLFCCRSNPKSPLSTNSKIIPVIHSLTTYVFLSHFFVCIQSIVPIIVSRHLMDVYLKRLLRQEDNKRPGTVLYLRLLCPISFVHMRAWWSFFRWDYYVVWCGSPSIIMLLTSGRILIIPTKVAFLVHHLSTDWFESIHCSAEETSLNLSVFFLFFLQD